jgi:beta-glucosidase
MRSTVAVVLVVSLCACTPDRSSESEVASAPAATWPGLTAHDEAIDALIARMTLEEKVGQMTQADQEFIEDDADVAKYFLGSVLSGGNSDPETNSLEDWTDLYDRLQSRALETRLGIPLLYGVDAVHGHNNVVGAVVFPHNIGLGATRDPELVEEVARVTALEVRATGIQWTFAPCVTVPQDERWGRTYEGFAEDPALVSELGAAAVRGFQSTDLSDPLRVAACAKHYVGDGGTAWGSSRSFRRDGGGGAGLDQGDTRVDEATLRRIHLAPYVDAIEAGVVSIMPSYSSWNGEKCSGSYRLLTEILKGELGFEGFLISDYNAIDQLPGDYRSDIEQSINAGMDMVMVPSKYREFFETLVSLAQDGDVPMSRIDDAVKRILRVKFALGMFEEGRSQLADRSLHARFGSDEHRRLARQAVRESLVLLKNEGGVLPLSKTATRIHVAGGNADDVGHQSGGWTIDWQGGSGDITPGTSILAALRQGAGDGVEVSFAADGSGAEGADVAVVVVGETPYAEGLGDRADLGLSEADVAAVTAADAAGVPVVLVVISGRPMILGDAFSKADAVVAAWLPGTEGQGVADVLFGDYAPTGKLPFTWPRSMDQIPINLGDEAVDPLLPYGFGLGY